MMDVNFVKIFNSKLRNNFDVIIASAVISIIAMIILPIPSVLLDILLTLNITLAIIIILLTMFTKEVLEFSVFPSLLLIATLFRLGLNVSSTRLILSQGNAGKMIESFGGFVAGDNYVVGAIIFIIIVIIQFIVITNGAGRVAEVAARFTLDAMPGKQMSIDADLNTGAISDQIAKKRREDLQNEADFYGAMDGASKFVKGDAIAGIVIVIINFVGGIAIFMGQKGLEFGEAIQRFGMLTIGDGLVSQVPALLISVASGILVTRSASKLNFGNELVKQLSSVPKVIAITSILLLLLGLVPALPNIPFLTLAAITGVVAYFLFEESKHEAKTSETTKELKHSKDVEKTPEDVTQYIRTEPLEIDIGYGLISLADKSNGGDLMERIATIRRQCATEMGIVVQPIRIRDNLQLKSNEYIIKIRGNEIAKGELYYNKFLVMDPGSEKMDIEGISTIEPTFGLPAIWIDEHKKEEAEIKGFTVVDPVTVLVTHLDEIIKRFSNELLGRQEVKMLLDMIRETNNAVVEELVPEYMTIGDIQKVLQNLLCENVPIRDLVSILETLADYAINTKDIELLTEYVRYRLGRTITKKYIKGHNILEVITIHPDVEQTIYKSIQKSFQGSFPALNPDYSTKILSSIDEILMKNNSRSGYSIVLTSPRIRAPLRKLLEMTFPDLPVLSLNEIPNSLEIEGLGMVKIDEN